MALEALDAIRGAEAEADRLLLEAQQSAREMISAAQKAIANREREADIAHAAALRALVEERRIALEAEIMREREGLRASREKALDTARALLPRAAEYIVEKVLDDGRL